MIPFEGRYKYKQHIFGKPRDTLESSIIIWLMKKALYAICGYIKVVTTKQWTLFWTVCEET